MGAPRKYLVELDESDVPHVSAMPKDAAAILIAASLSSSYLDLSFELGVPVGTVKSRLHRARSRLQRMRDAEAQA